MKMKHLSLLVKIALVVLGFGLCVLKWFGKLPEATISEIWYSIAFAYGVGLGTIDFNIVRDNWIEGRK
ncbi:MAG: hypothetical protein IIV96_04080 [Ruminococcus sp.]|nr:hypothetical protein [Ruminococcus sp.]